MLQIRQCRIDNQSPGRSRTSYWRLLGVLLTFLLFVAGIGHGMSQDHADVFSGQVLTAAASASDGPCGPIHKSGYHSDNCGLTASCSPYASVDVNTDLTLERPAGMAADAGLLPRGSESVPPFHPPKTSLTA